MHTYIHMRAYRHASSLHTYACIDARVYAYAQTKGKLSKWTVQEGDEIQVMHVNAMYACVVYAVRVGVLYVCIYLCIHACAVCGVCVCCLCCLCCVVCVCMCMCVCVCVYVYVCCAQCTGCMQLGKESRCNDAFCAFMYTRRLCMHACTHACMHICMYILLSLCA
jgi:hypothetical protein